MRLGGWIDFGVDGLRRGTPKKKRKRLKREKKDREKEKCVCERERERQGYREKRKEEEEKCEERSGDGVTSYHNKVITLYGGDISSIDLLYTCLYIYLLWLLIQCFRFSDSNLPICNPSITSQYPTLAFRPYIKGRLFMQSN